MKVLESQSAILTNFEVYQHLLNEQQKAKLPDRKRQVPRNLQTVIKEVRPDATSPVSNSPARPLISLLSSRSLTNYGPSRIPSASGPSHMMPPALAAWSRGCATLT